MHQEIWPYNDHNIGPGRSGWRADYCMLPLGGMPRQSESDFVVLLYYYRGVLLIRPLSDSPSLGVGSVIFFARIQVIYCTYSLSHVVQITDFLDFLHEYWKEKSETFK